MTPSVANRIEPFRAFRDRRSAAPLIVRNRATERCSVAFLTIIVGYAVFKTGGRSFIDWNVCLLSLGVVALVFWLRTDAAERAPIEPWLAWTVLLPPAYVAMQLVPLPMGVLKVLSPARADLAAMLGTVMAPPAFAALSINPAVTLSYLLNILGYALTFLLVREIAWRSRQRESWVTAIPVIVVAAAEAGLGLLQAADGAAVQGSYRNRNHFAGLLEMALPLAVAFATVLLLDRRARRASLTVWTSGGFLVAALILPALASSLSKLGFMAALCGLFAAGALALATSLRGATKLASIVGLAAVCLVVFVLLPSDQLVSRFGELFSGTESSEGRWPIARDAFHVLMAFPVFGSGLSTFGTAFLKYQTALVDLDFTFAHNDYLQLATEAGGAGFLIFIGLMLAVLVKAVRASALPHDWNTRALGFGCVGAIVAIGVHSFGDFNMYIPANPLVLAWISGIAVGLPVRPAQGRATRERRLALFDTSAVVLAGVLVVYAGGRVLLETAFRGNLRAEQQLCRIGICNTDAVLAAQAQEPTGRAPVVTVAALTEAVRRDAAAPYRWCDLGDAMVKAGRMKEARACFSTAVALGPNIPPSLLRAAFFYDDVGERQRALTLTSQVQDQTETYDSTIFDWYQARKMRAADILSHGWPSGGQRASQEYLKYLMTLGDFDDSRVAWDWLLGHRYADAPLAADYVNSLYDDKQYENAARSWALYLGDRRNGYLESTCVFNGGFESEPSRVAFDWRLDKVDDVAVALDSNVARSGRHSLRIKFDGQENVDYGRTYQTAFVAPGAYRFQAFVRANGITTDQGIRFRVSGAGVSVTTDQVAGTTDWTRVEQIVRVPDGTKLVTLQVVRQKSLKFDSHIAGTAWIDDVSLTRVE